MIARSLALVFSAAACALTPIPSAHAVGEPDCFKGTLHGGYAACYVPGDTLRALWAQLPSDVAYKLTPICASAPDHPEDACATDQVRCEEPPDSYKWWVWRSENESPFAPVASTCLRDGDSGEFDIITPGRVFAEMKKLDWPEAVLIIQPPDGKTLINLLTNFYTDTPAPAPKTVTLLGQQVAITAVPGSYTWHFGDGSKLTTNGPGAAYKSGVPIQIGHTYRDADVTVHPWVDVTYHGSYTVNGGDPQDIPEELTVEGARVDLQVLTATPRLVG